MDPNTSIHVLYQLVGIVFGIVGGTLGVMSYIGGRKRFRLIQSQVAAVERQRQDQTGLEVARILRNTNIRKAFALLLEQREPLTLKLVESSKNKGELKDAIDDIIYAVETCGALVYEGSIRLRVLDHMMGGFVRRIWPTIEGYVRDMRDTRQTDNYAEWAQWVRDRLEEHTPRCKAHGAHRFEINWHPTCRHRSNSESPDVCCCETCSPNEKDIWCKRHVVGPVGTRPALRSPPNPALNATVAGAPAR